MSLDNIQLPAFVIQDLFQKNLVDLNDTASEPIPAGNIELNVLGGSKQHILLIVNNAGASFVTDPELSFLSGILNACKLSLEDVSIFNIASYPGISYTTISNAFKPKIILMFGLSADIIQLPFVMPEFQRQSYNNQLYLSAPSLSELESNKDLKRKLWTALQQIFSL
jgi:DNA polymerase III psi subunit